MQDTAAHPRYLRNAWYAAAWSHELSAAPLGRRLLGEHVVLFRDLDDHAIALEDRCPHRFAPLSKGKLIGGALECPYHGLRFDGSGACVLNPQGNNIVTKRARVRTYPVLEAYKTIWIWMGDAGAASPSLLTNFSALAESDEQAVVYGYLNLPVNYQLIVDNLLDLSHVEFLHAVVGSKQSSQRTRFDMKQVDNTIFGFNWIPNDPTTRLHKMIWDGAPSHGDRRAHMRWDPPAHMVLDVGVTGCGRPESEGLSTPSAHVLTPETETSTHYFWAHARNMKCDDHELSQKIQKTIDAVFRTEDGPMMQACQERMGSLDLMSLRPVVLSTDAAAVRARRVLARLIEAEQDASRNADSQD